MVISAWPENSPRSVRAKFDQPLDTDGPAGIPRRDDLSMRTERTVRAERRT